MTDPLQEDRGLIKIHSVCVDMSAIWRPTPSHDLGVDGQIEFLEPGTNISTGIIVAVQSKAGPSYFQNKSGKVIKFYPKEKHKRYWTKLKLPIILVLHNPDDHRTVYVDVKSQLAENGPLLLIRDNEFNPSCRNDLISLSDNVDRMVDCKKMLDKFKQIKLMRDGGKVITGVDFLLTCVNKNYGYFEIRMCRIIALLDVISQKRMYGIGQDVYDYIFQNMQYIQHSKLVVDILDDFDLQWYELAVVPDIIAPLTSTGKKIVDYLWSHLSDYIDVATYSHLKIQDVNALAEFVSAVAQHESDRFDVSDKMGMDSK